MSVAITDRIRRGQSTAAPFAVAWEEDLKTSSVTVSTLSDRDTIPEWKRMGYMTCFVIATGLEYQLGSDTTVAGQVWTARTYGVPANVLVHDDILDVNNHILPQLIQNIFLNTSYVVGSQAAMLALTSFTGNFFIRTDLGQIFIKLNNTNPAAIGDFATSVTPSVISVNGQTGVVSITIANLLAVGANLTAFNTAVSSNTTVAANSAGIVTLNSAVATLTSSVSNLNSYVLSHLGTKNLSALMTSPGPVQNGYLVKWDNLNNRFDLISPTAGVGGGAVNFVNLLDVPATYAGQALKVVRVNAAETGLEFVIGGSNPFFDNTALIKNTADPTKLVIFSAASITTATTRTYTLPNITDTLVTLSSAGALSNKTGLISQWTNDAGYALSSATWLAASGATLTGNNAISGATFFVDFSTIKRFSITQSVQTAAWANALQITPGNHTSMTAGTEFLGNALSVNAFNQQWATGTLALQRWNYYGSPTIAFVGASTLTLGYNVFIDKVVAGTNATITTGYALGTGGNIAIAPASGSATLDFRVPGWGNRITSSGVDLTLGAFSGGSGTYIDFIGNNGAMTIARFIGAGGGTGTGAVAIGSTTTTNASLYINQATFSASWMPVFRLTPGAHTGMTLSTEFPNVVVDAVTQQWATGTLATQRNFWIKAPTISFVGASTATNAYNLYVDASIAGTNATITNNYALGVNGVAVFSSVTRGGTILNGELFLNSATGLLSIGTAGIGVPNMIINSRNGVNPDGTGGTVIVNDGGTGAYGGVQGATLWTYASGNVVLGSTTTTTAKWTVIQAALSASWIPIQRYISGSHTSMTAATEFIDYIFGGAAGDANSAVSTRTATWLAGTTALQRSMYIKGTVLTGASATATFSDAYTVYVDAPTVGANAAITRPWALATNGNFAVEAQGKIVFNTGGNQIGMSYVGGTFKVGWISSGAGNSVDIVDNGAASTLTRFIGSSSTGPAVAINSTTMTNGTFYVLQAAHGSAWKPVMRLDPGAHTTLTASTEFAGLNTLINTVTQQWATGALVKQRWNLFNSPTITFVGASTLSDAYNVWIDVPIAGTNATITRTWSLGIAGGLDTGTLTGRVQLRDVGVDNITINFPGNNSGFGLSTGGGLFAYPSANTNSGFLISDSTTGTTIAAARLHVKGPALSSSWNPVSRFDAAAHTAITNTLENIDYDFGGGTVIQTWAGSGTVTTNRTTYFRGRTLAGASAQTFTNAYTVYIDPPVAGTNATITNLFALGVNGNYLAARGLIGATIFATGNTFEVSGSIAATTLNWGTLATPQGGMTFSGNFAYIDSKLGSGGLNFRSNGSTQAAAITALQNFNIGATDAATNVAKLYIQQAVLTTVGALPVLRVDAGAHTNLTLSTEFPNFIINTVTQQWATGALTTQRNLWFKSPTLAFVAASTVTDAYNLYLDAPLAGTNATLTGAWALGINGKLKFVTQPTNDNAAIRILAVDPTTGEVKYRDSTSLGNTILTSTTVMTQSQVANSFSSPVTLLAAPGAGKFISIVGSVKFKYHFVTTAFTTGNNMVIQIGGNTISNQIAGTPLTIGADQYGSWGEVIWTGAASTLENGAVTFAFFTANPTGGGTSTVTITFEYIVKTL